MFLQDGRAHYSGAYHEDSYFELRENEEIAELRNNEEIACC
jgi:hypothetical protein